MATTGLESRDSYTVGWIAALSIEQAAALAMLDEEHERPLDFEQPSTDTNSYSWGRIGMHNVVIAALPAGMIGQASATATAGHMIASFPQIRIGLLVGIGGGIPRLDDDIDIRLGDVVISQPSSTNGGVAQYDACKATTNGFGLRGFLSSPPLALLSAVANLKGRHEIQEPRIPEILLEMLAKNPQMAKSWPGRPSFAYQGQENDRLFRPEYQHVGGKSCRECDTSQEVKRDERENPDPVIHYGVIASGNTIVKDSTVRAEVLQRVGGDCLCVETEAAGLINNFPCLVVRGVCDYADSHKNDRWQRYAVATAAAYAKELLGVLDGGNLKKTKRAAELLKEVVHTIHNIGKGVQNLSSGKRNDEFEKWLSPTDPSTNYNKALIERHPGSGSWLLQSAEYSSWKTAQNSFLWLNGIPGCGKTILSSTVIEDLKKDNAGTQNVLYFYFTFSETQKQSLENAVRTLASQLCYHRPEVRHHLNSLFSSCNDGKQQPSLDFLCKTFQQMVQAAGELWVVLDALDECNDRSHPRGLLPWIMNLRSEKSQVHLLVTSRQEQDIKSAIEKLASCRDIIPLQNDQIDEDIAAYIQTEVRDAGRLARWSKRPDIQQEIENALKEKASGMFRWVSCQLDALARCLDPPAVRKALASLPKTLDETYARILANLPDDYSPHTERLLQFLAYSERPIRLEEAVDALVVDLTKKPRFNKEDLMPDPHEISRYCSSLVVIVNRKVFNDYTWRQEDITEVQLAHFSVKEYLTSGRLEQTIHEDPENNPYRVSSAKFAKGLDETTARASIAQTCLAYLLELNPTFLLEDIPRFYPMAGFAASFWTDHAKAVGNPLASVRKLAMEFFSREDIYTISYRLGNPRSHKTPLPISYASQNGLLSCVQELLHKGADVNATDGYHGSALQVASSEEHLAIVQFLLEKGADINARSGEYGNALQAASSRGHLDIAQFLLENGADVNAQGGELLEITSSSFFFKHQQTFHSMLNFAKLPFVVAALLAAVSAYPGTSANSPLLNARAVPPAECDASIPAVDISGEYVLTKYGASANDWHFKQPPILALTPPKSYGSPQYASFRFLFLDWLLQRLEPRSES
ncbi:hypothetical protein BKA56DRAFT_681973 [Ilyonectria sp. MPI-CAGE-AT-0026]|nr:hypothetical protein BKA56DRAFT_681973 [Ilyonectria sp. MPI-CAGE-AT-0026]